MYEIAQIYINKKIKNKKFSQTKTFNLFGQKNV